MALQPAITHRPLYEIAREISRDWRPVNSAARPYLDAMRELTVMSDMYYCDTAQSVVSYFLANAASWRGDVARRIKGELKGMLPKPRR